MSGESGSTRGDRPPTPRFYETFAPTAGYLQYNHRRSSCARRKSRRGSAQQGEMGMLGNQALRLRMWGCLVLALVLAPELLAEEASPIGRGIGRPVPDFTLKDAAGKPVRLYGFRGKKAVVRVFLGTDCP